SKRSPCTAWRPARPFSSATQTGPSWMSGVTTHVLIPHRPHDRFTASVSPAWAKRQRHRVLSLWSCWIAHAGDVTTEACENTLRIPHILALGKKLLPVASLRPPVYSLSP